MSMNGMGQRRGSWRLTRACCLSLLSACDGAQSALDPAGESAARIARLFWQMTVGAAVIWTAVVGLALYAMYRSSARPSPISARSLIVGGGVIVPTVVLAGLLSYGLGMLPPLLAAAPTGSQHVSVTGEQYWWRVRYPGPHGQAVELANEIRLPVNKPVEFELASSDVIHSFWLPSLGGKVDMIPGRTTHLTLHPTRIGVFRGVCAEYCGTSHALMALRVVVLAQAEFASWFEAQRRSATPAGDTRGAELFVQTGCGACHSVRGTSARGVIGPDLTHVGSRLTLGAGALPNDVPAFERWIAATEQAKPGSQMPHFGMLPREHVQTLAAYLESLQ